MRGLLLIVVWFALVGALVYGGFNFLLVMRAILNPSAGPLLP